MRNPVDVVVKMKLIEKDDQDPYYIGNCDMDVNIKDCVFKLFEPQEGEKEAKLIINRTDERILNRDEASAEKPARRLAIPRPR